MPQYAWLENTCNVGYCLTVRIFVRTNLTGLLAIRHFALNVVDHFFVAKDLGTARVKTPNHGINFTKKNAQRYLKKVFIFVTIG